VFPDRSEGFASLALGYRNVAPLGLGSVGGQLNESPKRFFKNHNEAKAAFVCLLPIEVDSPQPDRREAVGKKFPKEPGYTPIFGQNAAIAHSSQAGFFAVQT
jgi:hypothetical protein